MFCILILAFGLNLDSNSLTLLVFVEVFSSKKELKLCQPLTQEPLTGSSESVRISFSFAVFVRHSSGGCSLFASRICILHSAFRIQNTE